MSPTLQRTAPDRVDRARARSVLWLLLAVYTATYVGLPDNPDGEVGYQTTRSLALRGSLAIGGTPEAETILEHARSVPPGGATVRAGAGAAGERYYAWFGVGQALAGVPFFWLGRALAAGPLAALERDHDERGHWGVRRTEYVEHLAVGWRNPLLAAMTGWLVVLVARRLGARRTHAWIAGAAFGLTTFAWPQARSSLSDVQATFFLFLAFHLLLGLREDLGSARRPAAGVLLGLGGALGAAVLTRVAVAGGALVLGCAAIAVLARGSTWSGAGARGRAREALLLVLPVAAASVLFVWTNVTRFGAPFDSGYGPALRDMGLFSRLPWRSLAGLLFSPGRGLTWFAPGILLAPLGMIAAWRSGERAWPLCALAVSGAILVPAMLVPGWHGAWTYGPRYLLPLLPFAWVGVALALTAGEGRRVVAVAAGVLFALGTAVQLCGVLVDTMCYHELAVRAAPLAWPAIEGVPGEAEAERFERMQWDLGFAAPLAHGRILRHRIRTRDESFPVSEIFRFDARESLRPTFGGNESFRHLAWIDLHDRLGRSLLWPLLVVGGMLALALVEAWRPQSPQGAGRAGREGSG